ncbi:acyloxyacyl hydrolase [uncultured Roseibium sp.]|uniref:acyloxyacyl hydrolase n=1 Tax=uncultured Roseibium sp. TaxID=1936171 RepID=UPI0032164489
MKSYVRSMLFGAFILTGASSVATAADLGGKTSGLTNEIRGGVLFHDLMSRENGVDINAEVLFRWAALDFTIPGLGTNGMLRPHIGGNLNVSGDTSMVYAGYTLTLDLTDWMYIEGSFGGMAHNGNTSKTTSNSLALGCNVMFRESGSLGFRINERVNVSAMIEHSSNNGYCSSNNGLTNAGVRLGYAF